MKDQGGSQWLSVGFDYRGRSTDQIPRDEATFFFVLTGAIVQEEPDNYRRELVSLLGGETPLLMQD